MPTFEDEIKKHLAQLKADRVTKLAESIAPKYTVEELAQAIEQIQSGQVAPATKPKNIAPELNKVASKKVGK